MEIGSKVQLKDSNESGEVMSIKENRVSVKMSNGTARVFNADELDEIFKEGGEVKSGFSVESNQYIPYGSSIGKTYYYVVNEKGQTINKKTDKVYKGKQMNNYKFSTENEAKKYAKKLNNKYKNGGGIGDKVYKKYYVIDDNNNGFWQDELSDREKAVMVYNPKTDVWHTRRNYEDYYFKNCTKNPREYAKGGGVKSIESKINAIYKKSGFINDDFNWKLKLLEMLQDRSIEAYNIYQSLSAEQKEQVLQEQYEVDNDMGSDGDGTLETTQENIEIMLKDAKKGKKYAKGGGVDNYPKYDINEKGHFAATINGKNYEIIYRDDTSQMYDLFQNGNKIASDKSIRNLMSFDKYANGGNADVENNEMVLNNNKQIKHHTEELPKAVKGKKVPAWVVAKVNRAASDLSDATHYMDGQGETYESGGYLNNNDICIKRIVAGVNKTKKVKDYYIHDRKLIIILNDELGVYDVEILNHHLKESESCSHISDGEFEIGYGEEYKTLILPLKTNDFTIGKFKNGGHVSAGEMNWNKMRQSQKLDFLYNHFTPRITPRGQEILSGKQYRFLPKEVKIEIEKYQSQFGMLYGVEYADGGGVEGFAHLPFGHEIAFSTEGDYDLEIDDFEDKLKIIHKHIKFDNVEGESDSYNTNLKFYKNGKRVASLVGSYNENTETYDSEFVVNDYSSDINFHPYNSLGGLNIKEFDLEIKNAVSESKTYSAVVSIEGYEVEGQEFEDKKRAEVGIKDLKEKTHFNLVKGKRFGQGKRVEQDRVLDKYANGGGVEFVPEKKGTLIKGNEIIKYFEKVNGNYRLVFYKLDKAKGKVPKICDAFEYCQELDSNDVTAEQLVELIKKNNLMENGGSIIESSSKSFTYTIGGL